MGIRQKIIVKTLFLLLLLILVFITPWWVIIILGGIGIFTNILSIELVFLGLIFDVTLIERTFSFYGLFYSLIFFLLILLSIIVKRIKFKRDTQ